MPRLGLLAVAISSSVVKIYSMPHPDALRATMKQDNSGETGLPLFLVILKGTYYPHFGFFVFDLQLLQSSYTRSHALTAL